MPPNTCVLQLLTDTLKDRDHSVVLSAIRALGEIHDERAVDVLITHLRDSNTHIWGYIANALSEIGEPAVEKLIRHIDDPNPNVQCSVVVALGKMRNQEAVKPLIDNLVTPNQEVASHIAWALGQIKNDLAIEPLVTILQESSTTSALLGISAIKALGNFNNGKLYEVFAEAMQEQPLREAAIRSLSRLNDVRSVPLVINALHDDSPDEWNAAYDGIKNMGSLALDSLIAVLDDPDVAFLYAVVELLGELRDPQAVTPLMKLAHHPDEWLRRTVHDAVAKIQDKAG